jgi:hypothetical protein
MLTVTFYLVHAECHYTECRNDECRYAECRGPPKCYFLVLAFGPCSLKHFPYNRKQKCLSLSVTTTLV